MPEFLPEEPGEKPSSYLRQSRKGWTAEHAKLSHFARFANRFAIDLVILDSRTRLRRSLNANPRHSKGLKNSCLMLLLEMLFCSQRCLV
eukprot:s951_g2.t3